MFYAFPETSKYFDSEEQARKAITAALIRMGISSQDKPLFLTFVVSQRGRFYPAARLVEDQRVAYEATFKKSGIQVI